MPAGEAARLPIPVADASDLVGDGVDLRADEAARIARMPTRRGREGVQKGRFGAESRSLCKFKKENSKRETRMHHFIPLEAG